MVKKITLVILILLCCVTGYSQSRRPKSAKKPTIQDVITEKKTPEDILKEVYKARLDSASQFSYTCMQYLVETKVELDSVKKANQMLVVEIKGDHEDAIHERWDWVMAEMIYAFEEKTNVSTGGFHVRYESDADGGEFIQLMFAVEEWYEDVEKDLVD